MLIIAFEVIVARPLFSESVHYFQFFGHFVLLNTTKYLQICFFILVLHYRLLKRVLKSRYHNPRNGLFFGKNGQHFIDWRILIKNLGTLCFLQLKNPTMTFLGNFKLFWFWTNIFIPRWCSINFWNKCTICHLPNLRYFRKFGLHTWSKPQPLFMKISEPGQFHFGSREEGK